MGFRQVRAKADGLPAVDDSLLVLTLLHECSAQVTSSLGRRGIEQHGLAEMNESRDLVTGPPERLAEAVVGRGEIRLEPDGFTEMADRVVEVSSAHQRQPQVTVNLRVVGLNSQGGPATFDGSVVVAE